MTITFKQFLSEEHPKLLVKLNAAKLTTSISIAAAAWLLHLKNTEGSEDEEQ